MGVGKACFIEDTTTPVDSIKVVQYKLTYFANGKPKPVHEVICERLTHKMEAIGFSQIISYFHDKEPIILKTSS